MTTPNQESNTGRIRACNPTTAFNLSSAFAGLGQIYCGAIGRGIGHMGLVAICLLMAIAGLFVIGDHTMLLLIAAVILTICLGLYSGLDARRIALRTRPDYRLADFNRLTVYGSLVLMVLCAALGLAFMIKANLFEVYRLSGNSMSPTMENNQRILVYKDAYRKGDPSRQDLVVFRNPSDRQEALVMRVIALPGDSVECRDGLVYINDTPEAEARPTANFPRIEVPENHIYVLGDNRAQSQDSRHIGPVPIIALSGRVGGNLW